MLLLRAGRKDARVTRMEYASGRRSPKPKPPSPLVSVRRTSLSCRLNSRTTAPIRGWPAISATTPLSAPEVTMEEAAKAGHKHTARAVTGSHRLAVPRNPSGRNALVMLLPQNLCYVRFTRREEYTPSPTHLGYRKFGRRG